MHIQNIPDYDVEHSEVLLYHVRVLEELGEFNEALNLLDVSAKSRAIIDRVAIMEFRGMLQRPYASHIVLTSVSTTAVEAGPDRGC